MTGDKEGAAPSGPAGDGSAAPAVDAPGKKTTPEAERTPVAEAAPAGPGKRTRTEKPKRVGFGVEQLPDVDRAERLHCSGRQVPSPMGDFLVELGVRSEPDGTSTVLFECKNSALRYELPLRVTTWRERRKVRRQAIDGLGPLCPRAELGPPLERRGDSWYCPRCNLMFGRLPEE